MTRALLATVALAILLICGALVRHGAEQAGGDAAQALRRQAAPGGPWLAPHALQRAGDITAPPPQPPPQSCDQRHAGVTAIQVLVRIDDYQGLITGRNGDHEIAYGTIVATPWVYDAGVVDSSHVQLALNVATGRDPSGLPQEEPLSPGQVVEVEGEYIPASSAHAGDRDGPAAVLHFSHAPCGYIKIGDQTYR